MKPDIAVKTDLRLIRCFSHAERLSGSVVIQDGINILKRAVLQRPVPIMNMTDVEFATTEVSLSENLGSEVSSGKNFSHDFVQLALVLEPVFTMPVV